MADRIPTPHERLGDARAQLEAAFTAFKLEPLGRALNGWTLSAVLGEAILNYELASSAKLKEPENG